MSDHILSLTFLLRDNILFTGTKFSFLSSHSYTIDTLMNAVAQYLGSSLCRVVCVGLENQDSQCTFIELAGL
jgi:hypothetical protein